MKQQTKVVIKQIVSNREEYGAILELCGEEEHKLMEEAIKNKEKRNEQLDMIKGIRHFKTAIKIIIDDMEE
jgi:hypothetical protein